MTVPRLLQLPALAVALTLPAALLAQDATPQLDPADSVVLVRSATSLHAQRGSGFLVGDGGWVVTASHVVSLDLGQGRRLSDHTVTVYLPWTGQPLEARVAAVDPVSDTALLRLPRAGFPALPLEGLEVVDAAGALDRLKDRPLRLYGFPLSYGADTVAALAKPEHNDARLHSIARREQSHLCILTECKDAQPGWSGGPVLALDRRTVVGVFHSLYRPDEKVRTVLPAGSPSGYLAGLLQQAKAGDPAGFTRASPPAFPRAPKAGEILAAHLRSLSWSGVGRWKEAEQELREALALTPDDPLAMLELARLQFVQKRPEEAEKTLREAARRAPSSSMVQTNLARTLHYNYNGAGARAAIQAALAASPDDPEPHLALADVLEAEMKTAEAEQALRAAVAKHPQHPGLLHRLGLLLVKSGTVEEGMKVLQQAGELAHADPSLEGIAVAYGRALEQARKLEQAETAYRKALKANPENGLAYFYLAQLYFRMRRYDDAQIQLNQGIRLKHISDSLVEAFRTLQERIAEKG